MPIELNVLTEKLREQGKTEDEIKSIVKYYDDYVERDNLLKKQQQQADELAPFALKAASISSLPGSGGLPGTRAATGLAKTIFGVIDNTQELKLGAYETVVKKAIDLVDYFNPDIKLSKENKQNLLSSAFNVIPYFKKEKEAAKNLSDIQDKIEKFDTALDILSYKDPNKSISKEFSEGNVSDALSKTVDGVVEAVPYAMMSIAGGYGGLALIGTSAAGDSYTTKKELDPTRAGDLSTFATAIGQGGIELTSEMITRGLFRGFGKTFTNLSPSAIANAYKSVTKTAAGKVISGGFIEAVSENAAQEANRYIDYLWDSENLYKYQNEDGTYNVGNIIERALDTGLISAIIGGGVSGVAPGSNMDIYMEARLEPPAFKKENFKIVKELNSLIYRNKNNPDQLIQKRIIELKKQLQSNKVLNKQALNNFNETELVDYATRRIRLSESIDLLKDPEYQDKENLKKLIDKEAEELNNLYRTKRDIKITEKAFEKTGTDVDIIKFNKDFAERFDLTEKEALEVDGFIRDNQVFINEEAAVKKGSISVASHELLHRIINNKLSDSDTRTKLAEGFKSILEKEGTLNIVQKRIDDNYRYDKDGREKALEEYAEEYFTVFSDAIVKGDIKYNESIADKILKFFNSFINQFTPFKQAKFETSRQAYDFVKDYAQNIRKGVVTEQSLSLAGQQGVEGVKGSITQIGDQIKALVPEGTTKQQYDSQVIGDVYNDLVIGDRLNGLIRGQLNRFGVTGDNVFGKSISNFVEDVKQQLFERSLTRFNPETNDDLGGFVVSELQQFRIGDVVNRYRREQAGSLDVQAGETGSIRTPVADEVVDVETTEAPRSELKQGLRVNGEQFVDQKLEDEIEANTIEIVEGVTPETNDKDFKTFVKDAAQQKSFKSVKGKLKNFEKFLEDNHSVLFNSNNLPIATLVAMERRTPAADRIFTGEPVRLTTQAQIDKAIDEGDFYVENEKQGPSKYPRKKPTVEQVKKHFGLDKGSTVGASTKGTRKDGLVNAISFSLFRDIVPGVMNRADIVQEDIAKVSAKLVVDPTIKFSLTGKKGIDDIVDKSAPEGIIKNRKDKVSYTKNIIENFNEKTGLPTQIFLKSTNVVTGNKASTAIQRNILGVNNLQNTSKGVVNKKITEENIKAEADGLIFEFSKAAKIGRINSKEINPLTNKVFTDQELNDLNNFNRSKTRANQSKNIQEIDSIKRGEKLFLNILQKKYNEDNSIIEFISEFIYNSDLNSNTGRNAAALIGEEEGVGPLNRTEEHTYQANNWARRTLQAIVSGSEKILNGWADWSAKNYYQITIQKKTDDKLNLTYDVDGVKYKSKSEEHPLLKKSLDEAFKTGDFSNVLSSDIRYFNPNVSINANTTSFMGESFAKKYNVEIDAKYKNNEDIALFQADLIYRQITDNNFTPDKARKELNVYIDNLAPSIVKLPKKNKTKYSKSTSNNSLLNDLNNHDKALRNARNLNAPKKGISIFDFDDTLATSKSKVIVEMPNGTTKEITPAEFAKQHSNLEQQGASFDFSQFNKVIDGKPGPLVAKIKKAIDKFGNKDVFVLTARPQASATSIKAFLDGIGVNIPLENITGLEDGTPQAKANWVIGKAGEGYNDFYFTDDVYKNVKAVQDALEVLDVKSKTRLAYSDRVKKLDRDFNDIIEAKTGIAAEKEYSRAKAAVVGANKGKFNFFIPPSAEDFVGLLYNTLSKGKLGDSQMAWYKKNLIDPFASAMAAISRERIALMDDYKALKKQLGIVPKNLRKKIPDETFTNEQALRVYIWNKQGMTIPGLSKADLKELTDYIENNTELKVFGDQLIAINKAEGYTAPTSSWLGGTITTDIMRGLGTTKRAKHLQQWQQNVDIIFSEKNLNKLEAANGKAYRVALEKILQRMKTGINRSFTGDTKTGKLVDWLTNSIGTIMFFNTRSALLQTISAVNFINFSDNNIFKAGKAYANQKQFWSDFMTLMNSEFLVDRRRGLRINVNEADIANMANQGGARGVVSKLLEFGFLPTQIADSFAIASGGATFYRNRINTYKKQGISDQQAQEQAFNDFREIAEESQQSSRPDRISQEQAGPLGRVILAFANTPAQYARLIKKAALDLKNRRGDVKTNISKIIYYTFVQNLIFNALQQAIFAVGFGNIEDEEDEKEKYTNVANGMLDSLLRGMGLTGAYVSVGKNMIMRVIKEQKKDDPEYEKVVADFARLSPPISSKFSRLRQAGRAFSWEEKEMREKGFAIDNPALQAGANVISAATNIPIDRLVRKANNVNTAVSQDLELWERFALLGGWQDWELGIDDEPEKSKEKAGFGETKPIRKVKRRKKELIID